MPSNEPSIEQIDIRDYFNNNDQPLCITDGNGIILYMNDQYIKDTGMDYEKLKGKPEPFPNSISKIVKKQKKPVFFGNDGKNLEFQNARLVRGVPIFSEDGSIAYIIITLDTEELVYQRYSDIRNLMHRKDNVRIMQGEDNMTSLLGKNSAIKDIRNLIRKAAPTNATVLITGESGSGKEVVADCIQSMSKRKGEQFVKINCAAIPVNLLEAELFGYERGAFTGANARKIGLLEVANHGTVFLDEIGDFPMELQPKLLRFLQTGEFYRIGSSTVINVDVRVIAATNNNLSDSIKNGTFREDLFYRINVFPIKVPPLRERRDDIIGLAEYFLEIYCNKYERFIDMPPSIRKMLRDYDWPGNVRELQNVIEYYVICSEPGHAMETEQMEKVLKTDRKNLNAQYMTGDDDSMTMIEKRDAYEKKLILEALENCSTVRGAAKKLGIYPSSLYRKAAKYNISIPEELKILDDMSSSDDW